MKVETSYRRPTKLPANHVGTDSGTFIKFLAVKAKKKKIVMFQVPCQKKTGSIGRLFFFFFFLLTVQTSS